MLRKSLSQLSPSAQLDSWTYLRLVTSQGTRSRSHEAWTFSQYGQVARVELWWSGLWKSESSRLAWRSRNALVILFRWPQSPCWRRVASESIMTGSGPCDARGTSRKWCKMFVSDTEALSFNSPEHFLGIRVRAFYMFIITGHVRAQQHRSGKKQTNT